MEFMSRTLTFGPKTKGDPLPASWWTTRPTRFSAIPKLKAPASLPVVICGMAGARQGWMEARYCDLPASLSGLAAAAVQVPGTPRQEGV